MLLPLVCALVYGLLSTRVMIDAALSVNGAQNAASLAVRAWGLCLRLDGTIEREGAGIRLYFTPRYGSRQFGQRYFRGQARKLRAYSWAIRAAMRTVRIGQVDWHMRVGTQEASLTAMIAGGVRSAIASFLAFSAQRPPCDIRIEADFHTPCFVLDARCIFSLVPGDIMIAVVKAAVKKTQREGFKWLSIPLRA